MLKVLVDLFIDLIVRLQYETARPVSYGPYHLFCLFLCIVSVFFLIRKDRLDHDGTLRQALGIFGFTALILEIAKQVVWSYDGVWHYQWYAAPFQLCTTPIYSSIAAYFLPKGKIRSCLLSYIAFVTILGSLATAVYPRSCFVNTLLVNIHTMFLHMGSLALSVYLLVTEVSITWKSYTDSLKVFLVFAAMAEVLNITVFNSGVLKGQTFNMFYISPYFISELPVFSTIQQRFPFVIFILLYFFSIMAGSWIVYMTAKYMLENKGKHLHETETKERNPEK